MSSNLLASVDSKQAQKQRHYRENQPILLMLLGGA
jgi:hypothetical protein